jgi:hypothetical protein
MPGDPPHAESDGGAEHGAADDVEGVVNADIDA